MLLFYLSKRFSCNFSGYFVSTKSISTSVKKLIKLHTVLYENRLLLKTVPNQAMLENYFVSALSCYRKYVRPHANGRHTVGCYMSCLTHTHACCCMLLGVVSQSLKMVKRLATCKQTLQHPTLSGQQCRQCQELLRPFARSFALSLTCYSFIFLFLFLACLLTRYYRQVFCQIRMALVPSLDLTCIWNNLTKSKKKLPTVFFAGPFLWPLSLSVSLQIHSFH